MNDMNDGPARDSNPQPLACKASTLPTELLGLADQLRHIVSLEYLISEKLRQFSCIIFNKFLKRMKEQIQFFDLGHVMVWTIR